MPLAATTWIGMRPNIIYRRTYYGIIILNSWAIYSQGGGEMGENCLQLAHTSKYLTIQGDREKEGNRRTGRKKEINRLGEIQ